MVKSHKNKKISKRGGKTQKIWKMKGCSKSKLRKHRHIKSKKRTQRGGGCGCGAPFLQGGGSGLLTTHVGSPWSGNVGGWPGYNGPHSGSWLSQNLYKGGDPQTEGIINERTIQFTGEKPDIRLITGGSKKHKKKMKGGSLLGNMKFGLGSAYNTLYGYKNPVNPAPYEQPSMSHMTLSELVR
jgi:hypothetical protein